MRARARREDDGAERRRRPVPALRWLVPLLVVAAALAALAWWQGWLPGVGDRLEYEALYNRGQASLAVGDYQGAKEAFAGLARLAPDAPWPWPRRDWSGRRGWSRSPWPTKRPTPRSWPRIGTPPRPRLRSILAVDPVYADAGERLEFVLRQREASTLFRAGVAAYDDGNFSQAIEQLERLSELDAAYQRDAVRELLFVLYLRDGRALLATPDASADVIRQALARFGKALALRPRNVEAAEERQLANQFLGVRQALDREDLAQAEAALADLLASGPTTPMARPRSCTIACCCAAATSARGRRRRPQPLRAYEAGAGAGRCRIPPQAQAAPCSSFSPRPRLRRRSQVAADPLCRGADR